MRHPIETAIVILLVLWLLGWLVFPIAGSLVHLLLVLILAAVFVRLIRGQRPIP